ncbi:MAG: TRAP transporter substrate-binding protein DctP [Pseudomonadota bacterium]
MFPARARLVPLLFAVLGSALVSPGAAAAEVTLKAVSSFAEGTAFSRNFEKFVAKVNAEGKGLVQIKFIGGPKAMPPFEVGNAVRKGVVDMANVTGAYYTNLLPESDALNLSMLTAKEMRKNGAWEYINRLWNQKVNAYYLARVNSDVPYHIYLNKKIDRPDLTGMKMRVAPTQRDFFVSLGASVVQVAPGEVYTALERGVIDGYGWPAIGILDLGWHERTKYRVEPGFYNAEVGVLVNLDTWNKLDAKQREFLQKQALWLEELGLENTRWNEEEKSKQAAAGIQPITFTGKTAEEFKAKAYDAAWAGIIAKSPEHGPKLRALLSK